MPAAEVEGCDGGVGIQVMERAEVETERSRYDRHQSKIRRVENADAYHLCGARITPIMSEH
jgi:hypothetical protein